MNIARFSSHRLEQPALLAVGAKRSQFDAGTMRGQTAHDPVTTHLYIRIGSAYRPQQNCRIEDLPRRALWIQPMQSRWRQRFSFPGDAPAFPLCDGDQPQMSQASQACDSFGHAIAHVGLGQQMFHRFASAFGDRSLDRRQAIDFAPEHDRIAQLAFGDGAQPIMALA